MKQKKRNVFPRRKAVWGNQKTGIYTELVLGCLWQGAIIASLLF